MAHELTAWLDAALAEAGLERTGPVDESRVRPWASVLSAPTTGGTVWLKATGPGNRYEVGLYEVLVRLVPDRVLHPIATDTERGLLLLPDGGPTLPADDDLRPSLRTYADLQQAIAPHVPDLLAAGVPDMRPEVLPERFDEAVEYAGEKLDPRVPPLRPRFADWCAELAASDVASSIDHNDLHADNVLAGPRFYDWGDACIAHPFASLLLPTQLSDPERHDALRLAYLERFGDPAELDATARLACRVALVARALTWKRALGPNPTGDLATAAADHLAQLLA